MSIQRTPPGYGIDSKHGGSQPNLSDAYFENEPGTSQITMRNKRKHDDDTTTIKKELSDLKKQMAEMMALLTVSSKSQKENIDKLCQNVATIKDDMQSFRKTIDHIINEQENIKLNVEDLKTATSNIDQRIEALNLEINSLQNQQKPTTSSLTTTNCEELMTELTERNLRARNIIIIGIPESTSNVTSERLEYDKREASNITKAIEESCPEPDRTIRLGKYKAGVSRPLKVCFQAETTAKNILKNKNAVNLDNIKIYSDQTVRQRKYLEHLKEELKARIAKGESDLLIRYVKDTPKIVKSDEKKRNTQNVPEAAKFH